jgi:hypothetical protein
MILKLKQILFVKYTSKLDLDLKIFRCCLLPTTKLNQSRAEQSSSLLPVTSQHRYSWHRAPLGPMVIYLLSVKAFVFFPFIVPPLIKRERLGFFCNWCFHSRILLCPFDTDHIENTASSIVARRVYWNLFTDLLPLNALIKSVIMYCHVF